MSIITSLFSHTKKHRIEAVLAPHLDDLLRQAQRYTYSSTAAEDLFQDLCVYVCQREETLLSLDPVKPWLMKCLYHRFVDNYRKQQRRVDEVSFEPEHENINAAQDDTQIHEYREQLRLAMAHLSAAQRGVITLFDIEGYSLAEIADVLELSESTIKSHLHRGRKKLKELVKVQPLVNSQRLTL
ncbi:MAG: RNA polymerase sigma-70 factor (ECF subfamily) [Flavobacteriales bacterium]|jgi:RNA polymerase sigma-70 factor (ECF subfamily)